MKKLSSIIAALAIVASFAVPIAEARSGTAYYSSAYKQPIRVRGNLHAPGSKITRRARTAHLVPIKSNVRGSARRRRTAGNNSTARSRAAGYHKRNRATFTARRQRGALRLERRRNR